MKYFVILMKTVALMLLCATSVYGDIVKRAALDIGSGETKILIADVDTDTNKIEKIHFQSYAVIKLRNDLAASIDNTLSPEIQTQLISTLNHYKTLDFSPDQWFGVGTSVFRTASNGQEVLDRVKAETGVTIYLASQVEEGEIGFQSAVAASGLDANQVIAWDSGGGSFQITTLDEDQLAMYGEEFAMVLATREVVSTIRGNIFDPKQSPNPMTKEEADQLASIIQHEKLPLVPEWLAQTDKKVVGFGGASSIFSSGYIATGKEVYTAVDVLEAIYKLTGKTDSELGMFPQPQEGIVGLTLLYSVMQHCGIGEVSYHKTNGACEGLLIIPRYWE